jgi:hypothetical protein
MTRDTKIFLDQVKERLWNRNRKTCLYPDILADSRKASAVLFLLGQCPRADEPGSLPCILFNKRSQQVKQSGDLCFPGGSIAPTTDAVTARLLSLPFFPLGRWSYWKDWQSQRKEEAARLALLLATGLREGLEEMRLNPFGTQFLGPLPPNALQSFQKVIYPLVVWIRHQQKFFPNWEVEKMVSIPIQDLLSPSGYVCYRMHFESYSGRDFEAVQDFPGFLHQDGDDREVLWGATYLIVMTFLEIVFGFSQPDMDSLPVIDGLRDEHYFSGRAKKK